MTLQSIINTIQSEGGSWAISIILIMSIVEIVPIKVNPWSAILRWFGDAIGLADIRKDVISLNAKIDYNEAIAARYRIIVAADELRNGNPPSPEHLEQLGEDIETYKKYCTVINPEYTNHKGQQSMKMILEYEAKVYSSPDL